MGVPTEKTWELSRALLYHDSVLPAWSLVTLCAAANYIQELWTQSTFGKERLSHSFCLLYH